LSYDLGLLAGFAVNRTLDQRNQATQSADADLSYGVSRFVTLRLSDRFMNTTGLLSGAGAGATSMSGAGIGAVQEANSALFTYGRFRTNTVLAELSGQFSASRFGGVRGTQSYTWFPSGATSPVLGPLYGGQSYSAEAFYNHRFSLRNWGGITARGQRFEINPSSGRTDTVSLLFLYAVNIRPTMSLSFFGGPELSTTSVPQGLLTGISFPRRMWSPATGAVFSQQGHSTSETVSFTRQVSNSGGLQSAVTLSSIDAEILRRIGRRFAVGPAFGYTENVPIVTGQTFRTYSGRLQFTYQMGSHYSMNGGYARDQQASVVSNATASANRVWISFAFEFLKPIGR
jgi:hypothetical protein